MRRIILIANRLPVSLSVRANRISYRDSVGGVAIGLSSVAHHFNTLWIGAVNLPREDVEEHRMSVERELGERYNCSPVFLSREEIEGHYNGFSNSILWPLFHSLPVSREFPGCWWEQYMAVNRRFLDKVVEVLEPHDVVWVNDYHLLLLPGMLRREVGRHKIGFFLHVPFPESHIFERTPVGDDLLEGILGSDQVGVYTQTSKRCLAACVANYRKRRGGTRSFEREQTPEARVGVFQIGVDPARIEELLDREHVRHLIQTLRNKFDGKKVILSADRLDYTKGIPQKLRAYEMFLESHAEFKGRVQLVLIVGPSRMGLKLYDQLNQEVSLLARSINEKFGTAFWEPVYFINRVLPYEELLAFYGVADVALVTPLVDGMNLMAKEYLYVRGGEGGALILSKKAGAADELPQAYQVDPNNSEEIVSALKECLTVSSSQLTCRNAPMLEHLGEQTVVKWARDFVTRLDG
jgi:trehalose 6-phosphate synthase/phosphatase